MNRGSEQTGLPRQGWWPRCRAVIVILGIGLITSMVVGGVSKLRVETGVESFSPPADPAVRAQRDVASSFGGDPIVVLIESKGPRSALSGEQLPHLLNLEGKLSRLPDAAAVYGPATVLNQVAGNAQKLLAELSGYRDGLRAKAEQDARSAGASSAGAHEAAERAVAGFDARYGGLLAQGLTGGLPTLHNDRFVRSAVFNEAGEPRPQWHFVVPAPDAVAVLIRPRQDLTQEAGERLTAAVRQEVGAAGLDSHRVTVSGAPAVVSDLGAQARREAVWLGAAALLAVGAWFLLMPWTSWRRRLVPLWTTTTATAVTLALYGWTGHSISLGVVAFLPILLGVGSDFMTYLHKRVGGRVVASVGSATAASFAALAITPIPVVRELGLALALGMLVAVAAALVVAWRFPHIDEKEDAFPPAGPADHRPGRPDRRASRSTRIAAASAAGLLALSGWAALPSLPLRADFESFAHGLPALESARHVEDVLGSSGEMNVVLTGNDAVSEEALDWMRRAQTAIISEHGDTMRPTLSPPTLLQFLGSTPTGEQVDAAMRLLPGYLTSSVVRGDHQMSLMSFGVELNSAQETQELRGELRRIIPPPPPGFSVRVTGLPVIAAAAHEQVSGDRYLPNVLGIAVAGVVLAAGLRRRGDALRAVAAAVVASGGGLLGMWLAGVALTPVTVALGSLTAAVGCEFTVVLAEAARRADRGIHRAVVLAAAASATGYSVLMLSGLSVVREFGGLLAIAVVLAFSSAALVVRIAPPSEVDKEVVPTSYDKTETPVGAS